MNFQYIKRVAETRMGFDLHDYLEWNKVDMTVIIVKPNSETILSSGNDQDRILFSQHFRETVGFKGIQIKAGYIPMSSYLPGLKSDIIFMNESLLAEPQEYKEIIIIHELCHLLDLTGYHVKLSIEISQCDRQLGEEIEIIANSVIERLGGFNDQFHNRNFGALLAHFLRKINPSTVHELLSNALKPNFLEDYSQRFAEINERCKEPSTASSDVESKTKSVRIVCLGWGSLIWDPRDLKAAQDWYTSGPVLPIEFSRQSNDGRLTLVIDELAEPVPVLWSPMNCLEIDEAIESLRLRERIPEHRVASIGRLKISDNVNTATETTILQWAKANYIEAVVWTSLKPRFQGQDQRPTIEQALDYLKSLKGKLGQTAEEYIRKTPTQINTAFRRAIEKEFGWTPLR